LAIEHYFSEHKFTPTQKARVVEIQRNLEKKAGLAELQRQEGLEEQERSG
jgi:hypothetical protein